MTEFVHVGAHSDVLASGRHLAPSDRVDESELTGEDRWLVDDGVLLPVDGFAGASNQPVAVEAPTKPDLQKRAAELGIEGRSRMSVDELRDAIVTHEAGAAGEGGN